MMDSCSCVIPKTCSPRCPIPDFLQFIFILSKSLLLALPFVVSFKGQRAHATFSNIWLLIMSLHHFHLDTPR